MEGAEVQAVLARLQQAHQSMSQGEYLRAAEIFEALAAEGEPRRFPRTPAVYIQAGRARLLAGDAVRAAAHFEHGLMLLADFGRLRRLPIVAGRVLDEMRAGGLAGEADALETKVRQALARQGLALAPVAASKTTRLPAKCPHCGGTVHPQEVDWVDATSAACDYCGSILTAEA